MKDGYSFHSSFEDLQREYHRNMYDTYHRIFNRLGLEVPRGGRRHRLYRGTGSHEFHVIAETGEDDIAYCPTSDYAANAGTGRSLAPTTPRPAATAALSKVHTGVKTIDELAAFLKVPADSNRQGHRRRMVTTAPATNQCCCCCVATTNSTKSKARRSLA